MLKKFMATIGFGSAKVELKLPKDSFCPGETFQAQAIITAGNIEQQVEQFYLHLDIRSEYEDNDKLNPFTATVFTFKDGLPFVIGSANPQHIINLSCTIPNNIPLAYGRTRYTMEAGLDIRNAINPTAKQNVRIVPAPEQVAILAALEQLGFRHKKESGNYNGRLQWFEMHPTDFMLGQLDELEIAFKYSLSDLTVYMEIDKKAKGLMGMLLDELDMDERHVALKINNTQLVKTGKPDIEGTSTILRNFIKTEYEKIV